VYKHILIPTDGSRLSADAIEHGMALAQAINAKVTALTVSTPSHGYAPGLGTVADTPDPYKERTIDLAARYLAVATQAAAALDVSCDAVHVEHDHPFEAIINTAEELGCDAIVMASHGRRGVSAIVLGSETVKVLTHSAIPVVVVRGQPPGAFFAAS
jgi:nucleotide-binding universal stress UspA family protein